MRAPARQRASSAWRELRLAVLMDDNYRELVAEHVEALARKIAKEGFRTEHGVPIVRPAARARYWIVSGHHRISALRRLGFETVLCHVIDAGELEALVSSIEANSSRRDASVADEAAAFGRLAAGGLSAEQIGERIGRSEGYVARRLALLGLDPHVRHVAGRYGFAWAEALTELGAAYQREAVRVLDDGPISLAQFQVVVRRIREREVAETEAQKALFDADFGLVLAEWGAEARAIPEVVDDGSERVVGVHEACIVFAWRKEAVREWRRLGQMPEPEMVVNRGPAWWLSTLRDWWAENETELANAERSAAAHKAWATRRRMRGGK